MPGGTLLATPKLVLRGPLGQVIELKQGVNFDALGMSHPGQGTDLPVVFAGYGITTPEQTGIGYDDYRDIDVAGGGNMVIDFAEPLLLGPSEVAFVVLDFDLERSFPAAPGSAGPRWTLRPIVLVDVLREDVGRAVRAPTDLGGVVAKTERGAFDLELSDGRGVLKVRLAPGASVRGAGPEPLAPGAIRAGSRVLARGIHGSGLPQ